MAKSVYSLVLNDDVIELVDRVASANGLITATQIAITQYDVSLSGNIICNGIVIPKVTTITIRVVRLLLVSADNFFLILFSFTFLSFFI